MRIVAGALALATLAVLVVGSASARPRPRLPLVPASPARLAPVLSTADPHKLDLTQLVPRTGRINHVWYIPAGSGHAQIAVAWQQGMLRGTPHRGYEDTRRYYLALWNPQRTSLYWQKKWVPHTLVAASQDTIDDFMGSAIRLADVTGDGHDDLLVTILCRGCNHGSEQTFVVATFGRDVRRIYRQYLVESYWGARDGQLWFDYPYRNYGSGKRRLVFLKWHQGRGFRTVSNRILTNTELDRMRLLPWTR